MSSNRVLVYNLLPLLRFCWTSVVYEEKRDRYQEQANKQKIPFISLLSHIISLLNKNVL